MELPEGWQAAQAARCPCRGSDDYCLCVNEYNPARYGLQEAEKCGACGTLPHEGLYRFCTRADCPVREHLRARANPEDTALGVASGEADATNGNSGRP